MGASQLKLLGSRWPSATQGGIRWPPGRSPVAFSLWRNPNQLWWTFQSPHSVDSRPRSLGFLISAQRILPGRSWSTDLIAFQASQFAGCTGGSSSTLIPDVVQVPRSRQAPQEVPCSSTHQIARVVVTAEARHLASSALATRSRRRDLLRRRRGKNRLARPQAHGAPRGR